jgi:hypothetical protein
VVTTFYDNAKQVRTRKQAGKEHLQLLDEIDMEQKESDDATEAEVSSEGGVFSKMFGSGSGSGSGSDSNSDAIAVNGHNKTGETVHVFSLATGHLYERFLKIMMLSVVKRCSQPVKFWLFENYLSPTFKLSVEVMAEEFGFEVGFVTYKWPSWLRQQTSKQRIIWGYKILFLDVLFPLNVKRVIYVDSDQTVRGDLAELWHMDLKGRPYAYVGHRLPRSITPISPQLPLLPPLPSHPTTPGTRPSVRRKKRRWGTSSGGRATGRTISAAGPTIFRRFTWSTSTTSVAWLLATSSAAYTTTSRATRTRWRTSTRTCPTTRSP